MCSVDKRYTRDMSEVGTRYVWIEQPEEPVHHWYEPGTYISFLTVGGKLTNPYPVVIA